MRSFPTPYPNEPKVCSACGQSVLRKDCHKNRYGDYICRTCQAAGIKSTRGARLRHGTRRVVWLSWVGCLVVLLAGVLGWAAFSVFTNIDFWWFLKPAKSQ